MESYEVTIVGGGPAGLTAYLYAKRGLFSTILIEKGLLGGLVTTIDFIENYPGFPEGISGYELVEKMIKQVEKYGLNLIRDEVIGLTKDESRWRIILSSGAHILSYAVILALGAEPKKLGVPGEERLLGRGVSYCATCDGPFFRGETIAVVGGGSSALKEALFLTKFAERVYLIHRREAFRGEAFLQKLVLSNPKIKVLWNCVVESIEGKEKVEKILIFNKTEGKTFELEVSGIFIFVGYQPKTEWLKNLIELDEQGFIITDKLMRTSCPGIFACGDCVSKPFKQIVIACGEGAMAALSAEEYLRAILKKHNP